MPTAWITLCTFFLALFLGFSKRRSELVTSNVPSADSRPVLLGYGRDPATPFKGEIGVPKRVAWTEPIPLEDVRATAKALGASINDFLEWFPGVTREQVEAVLEHAEHSLAVA